MLPVIGIVVVVWLTHTDIDSSFKLNNFHFYSSMLI